MDNNEQLKGGMPPTEPILNDEDMKAWNCGKNDLFDYLSHNHGLSLSLSEMSALIHAVHKFHPQVEAEMGGEWWKNRALAAEKRPVWVKGVDGFPVRKHVIGKRWDETLQRTLVGMASSATGEMICFDWGPSTATLMMDHVLWEDFYWLDEFGCNE